MSNYKPSYFSREVAATLRGILARHELKQADMAALCGVSQSQFSKIIRGTRPMTLDQFAALADYVNHDYDDILISAYYKVIDYGISASPVRLEGIDSTRVRIHDQHLDDWAQSAAERMEISEDSEVIELSVHGITKDGIRVDPHAERNQERPGRGEEVEYRRQVDQMLAARDRSRDRGEENYD